MYRILQTGRTALSGYQQKMDTISNNIANTQTHGYKPLEVQFEDLVYDQVANRGVPLSGDARNKPIEIGTGSRVKSNIRRFIQGPLEETGENFHLALEGDGFFGVVDENGDLFLTRDGAFTLDSQGRLVDSRGNYVVMDGLVSLSRWKDRGITIDERGIIHGVNQQGQIVELGNIRLYNVPDKSIMISRGDNYFSTENLELLYSNQDTGEGWGKIHQKFLEKSSVDLGEEMVNMLVTQRAYQINTRSIHAADEMWSMVNQLHR